MKKIFIIGLTALLIPGILAGCSRAEQAAPPPLVEDQAGTVLPAALEETVDEARMIAEEVQSEAEEIASVLETQVEEAEAQLAGLVALSEKLESESQETLATLKEKMDQVSDIEWEEEFEDIDMDVMEDAVADLEEEVIEDIDMDVIEENLRKLLAAEETEEMALEKFENLMEEDGEDLVTGSELTDTDAGMDEVGETAVTENSETPIS